MKIEHWVFRIPLRLKSIFRRRRVESELDEELQFHLEHKIEEGIAEGLTPEEARYRALRAMGGLDQKKEEIRDTRGIHWLTDFVDDVRYAVRSLRRTPGLAAFVVATIALGIGMTATPFSMLDALVFRPYPVPRPGEVLTLVSTSHDSAFDQFSYREYLDIRERTKSYAGVIANAPLLTVGFSARPDATGIAKGGMLVSGNYFRVLDVEPTLGRGFRDDEDQVPGRDAVVVLSADFWRREFAGDPSVVGRTVRLNGKDFTVIGVLPEKFTGLYIFDRPDFYMPLAMARHVLDRSAEGLLRRPGRPRADGESAPEARARRGARRENELSVLARNLEREYPKIESGPRRGRPDDVRDADAGQRPQLEVRRDLHDPRARRAARGVHQRRRAASRPRAHAPARDRRPAGDRRRALSADPPAADREPGPRAPGRDWAGSPSDTPASTSWASSGFRPSCRSRSRSAWTRACFWRASRCAVLSALICGLAPALQSTRMDLVSGLKSADVDEPAGRKRLWGRNALVVAQIAMSLMLLAASFLMFRGFQHSLSRGLEFAEQARDHVLMVRFDPRLVQYDAARTERFYRLLAERARRAPGVRSAAFTQNPPLGAGRVRPPRLRAGGLPDAARSRELLLRRWTRSTKDSSRRWGYRSCAAAVSRRPTPPPRRASPSSTSTSRGTTGRAPIAVGKRIRLESASGAPVEIVGIAPTIKYTQTVRSTISSTCRSRQHPVARMVLLAAVGRRSGCSSSSP